METSSFDRVHAVVRQSAWLRRSTILTRVLLANIYLLCWDYDRLKCLFTARPSPQQPIHA